MFPVIGPHDLTAGKFFNTDELRLFFDEGKVLLIDKPAGWTSFDVVNKIRFACKAKRVGHAGTLDPFATGLLILCTGKATKTIDTFSDLDKVYEAEFVLGKTTDTLDIEGRITSEAPVPDLNKAVLQEICNKSIGEIEQIPPQFAAIKINGVPAYKMARKGKTVDIKPRRITIHAYHVLSYKENILRVMVECSKGTYIRALARDLGNELGCGAFVKSLRRLSIGAYSVENSSDVLNMAERIKQALATSTDKS